MPFRTLLALFVADLRLWSAVIQDSLMFDARARRRELRGAARAFLITRAVAGQSPTSRVADRVNHLFSKPTLSVYYAARRKPGTARVTDVDYRRLLDREGGTSASDTAIRKRVRLLETQSPTPSVHRCSIQRGSDRLTSADRFKPRLVRYSLSTIWSCFYSTTSAIYKRHIRSSLPPLCCAMEADSETYSQEKISGSGHITPSTRHTSRIAWPVYIIVGQIGLLSFALGLVAAVRVRGQIPLGLGPALFYQDNPHLFTQAVRHAIAVALTRPVSLSTLGYSILISRRSLVFSTEIDLSSTAFRDQFNDLWSSTLQDYSKTGLPPLSSWLTPISFAVDSALFSVIEEAGAASATAQAGYPALVDFGGWAHDVSTRMCLLLQKTGPDMVITEGGIFPIQAPSLTNVTNTTQLITVNTVPFSPSDSTSPVTLAMNQQGLTAVVSCEAAKLDDTTDPSLTRSSQTSGDFTYSSVSTVCANGTTFAETAGAWTSGTNPGFTFFLVGCENVDASGTTTYTAIIDGQQAYQGTYKCIIAPQIQNMISNYTGSIIDTEFDESSTPIDAGPSGFAGFYALSAVFGYGQSELRNSVGDAIQGIYSDQVYAQEPTDVFVELLEAYIMGIFEFTGTAVKNNLAVAGGAFNGNPPPEMTRSIAGNATATSLGWQYNTITSGLVLIPTIFVALVCIVITLVAQYYNRGIPPSHADFDPNNPLRLMAAASAGGMMHVFPGVDGEHVEEGLEKKVMLGQVGGRDGFVYA
ncbi:hypothetical protein GGX14DRAFT_409020 [Mycena pura]|uniref:Ig-like domain-containing protein n=1 Tax=Mycena pura TaxID=153505 RepID=A0AAD6XYW9_9AGAR|nr:hypothetical protein GGX14DRAFT_409020 [Mycena pura]